MLYYAWLRIRNLDHHWERLPHCLLVLDWCDLQALQPSSQVKRMSRISSRLLFARQYLDSVFCFFIILWSLLAWISLFMNLFISSHSTLFSLTLCFFFLKHSITYKNTLFLLFTSLWRNRVFTTAITLFWTLWILRLGTVLTEPRLFGDSRKIQTCLNSCNSHTNTYIVKDTTTSCLFFSISAGNTITHIEVSLTTDLTLFNCANWTDPITFRHILQPS